MLVVCNKNSKTVSSFQLTCATSPAVSTDWLLY